MLALKRESRYGVVARAVSTLLITAMGFQTFAAGYSFLPTGALYQKVHGRKITIMPFGDSITAGISSSYSYRYFLWQLLKTAGYTENIDFIGSMHGVYDNEEPVNPDFDQDHEGHPAYNTTNGISNLPDWLNGRTPDIVLMHWGTNDIGEGYPASYSKGNLSAMIDTIRNRNPKAIIMLARIIPAQVGAAAYPAFNDMITGLAGEKNTLQSPVILVDQNSGYLIYGGDYADLVHLSTQGEQKMASRWFEALVPVLDRMGIKPLEIKPATGELLQTGHFDITVTLNSFLTKPMMRYMLTLDGVTRYADGVRGSITNPGNVEIARTFRMKDVVPMYDLGGAGRHVFTFGLQFRDSTMICDTVVWDILDNKENF
jgi:acyl-CoA thioesterase-1